MIIIVSQQRAYLFIVIFVETQKKKLYPNEVLHQDFSRKIYVKMQFSKFTKLSDDSHKEL